jgi:hypothetical protein
VALFFTPTLGALLGRAPTSFMTSAWPRRAPPPSHPIAPRVPAPPPAPPTPPPPLQCGPPNTTPPHQPTPNTTTPPFYLLPVSLPGLQP